MRVLVGVIGLALIGLSVVTDAFRPYLLYVGIGLLVLGLVLIATRPRVRGIDTTELDAPSAAMEPQVLEPVAPPAPPRAEVALQAAGNWAPEPSVRWYQVAAATTTEVAAKKARVTVRVRSEHAVPEQWRWQAGDSVLDITQTAARIPIVIGRVAESNETIASGWAVPFKNWYLTPNASASPGPFLAPFIAGFRHVFDVTVTWAERATTFDSSAQFELRFWREPTSEPRFIRVGDRPTYQDQAGGLAELRDRGTVLRKEGMMLPLPALNTWLGRVDSWTSETRALIAEVSTADSEYFWSLKNFSAPLFEGIRMHDERHRRSLQQLHERLVRLQFFMRSAVPV